MHIKISIIYLFKLNIHMLNRIHEAGAELGFGSDYIITGT